MSRSARVGDVARKVLLSITAIVGVFVLALRAPEPFAADPSIAPPGEAMSRAPAPTTPASAFLVDGLPLGTESWSVDTCDLASWTPVGSELWTDGSMLLDLDRSADQTVAVWLDASARSPDTAAGAHHAARLHCVGGRGEVVHTWLAAPADPDAFRRHLEEPVTERDGPVPLLSDSVERLHFRNLDWSVHLDEPDDPSTAVERLHVAMAMRGWSAAKTPTSDQATGRMADAFEQAGDGRVLTDSSGGLCLVHAIVVESRDLLLVACRGLT